MASMSQFRRGFRHPWKRLRSGPRRLRPISTGHDILNGTGSEPPQPLTRSRPVGEFRMKRTVHITFLLTLLYGLPALAQQGASAGLHGSVSDSHGAIISGAKIELLQLAT